jgi:hypothetical protein
MLTLFSCHSAALAQTACNSRCCEEEFPKLVVQGEGKIETLPDKATFNIRLRLEEKKLDKAFEVSTERINAVTKTLNSFQVKKEDIRNLGYVYHPLYEGKKIFTTIDRPSSYEIIYTLKITLYDLGQLGKILVAFSGIPESTIYSLEYTSTKLDELKREALKKAAADAREKALKLAEGSGAILGKVMRIDTGATVYYAPRESQYALARAEDKMMAEAPAPQIESGAMEVTATCTIQYAVQ